MTIEERFEQHVLEKWNPTLNERESFINCILGIVGEFAEVAELGVADYTNNPNFYKDLISENGDMLYYLTRLRLLTGEQLTRVSDENCMSVFTETAMLIGGIKKLQFHNKPFDYENFRKAIDSIYTKTLRILEALEIDIKDVMLYNIEKLNKRHGEGISFKTYGQRLDAGQEA